MFWMSTEVIQRELSGKSKASFMPKTAELIIVEEKWWNSSKGFEEMAPRTRDATDLQASPMKSLTLKIRE